MTDDGQVRRVWDERGGGGKWMLKRRGEVGRGLHVDGSWDVCWMKFLINKVSRKKGDDCRRQ